MRAMGESNRGSKLEADVVQGLVRMLDEHNELAKVFRIAHDRFQESNF